MNFDPPGHLVIRRRKRVHPLFGNLKFKVTADAVRRGNLSRYVERFLDGVDVVSLRVSAGALRVLDPFAADECHVDRVDAGRFLDALHELAGERFSEIKR